MATTEITYTLGFKDTAQERSFKVSPLAAITADEDVLNVKTKIADFNASLENTTTVYNDNGESETVKLKDIILSPVNTPTTGINACTLVTTKSTSIYDATSYEP